MIAAVADTHAALWLLFGDPRLSASAKKFFETAADEGLKVLLSPISMAEVVYLVEKKRLPASSFENLEEALKDPDHILEEGPFTTARGRFNASNIPRSGSGHARSNCGGDGHLSWRTGH